MTRWDVASVTVTGILVWLAVSWSDLSLVEHILGGVVVVLTLLMISWFMSRVSDRSAK